MPLPVLIGVQLMQTTLLFAAFISLGLLLAPKVGIEMPLLQQWSSGQGNVRRKSFREPILSGIAVAGLSLLVFYTVFLSRIPEWPVAAEAMLPLWKRFLACFYGAINEEIVARLFCFTLILWLLRKIAHEKSPRAGRPIFWIANLIVAVLFALAHIPSAKLLMPITPLVILALLTINGAASLLFGYLCWKRGLEAAMLAHFFADFTLHVIGPMFLRG
jgi:membrane protease YdiL (CAAX protease family)